MRTLFARVVTVAAVAALAAVCVPAGAAVGQQRHHLLGQRITVGTNVCAPQWHAPNPGKARFVVRNDSNRVADIYFYRTPQNKIVGKLRRLAAQSHAPLVVHAKPGKTYAWACDLNGRTEHESESEKVPLHATHGGQGKYIPPVQTEEIRQPFKLYRTYVHQKLASLQTKLQTLVTTAQAGDLGAAEAAWLPAHLAYLRIGQDNQEYGAFGNLGGKIDATAAGFVKGVNDPAWSGFHKIEYDLWTVGDVSAAATDSLVLQKRVNRLASGTLSGYMPADKSGESDWTLRAHEVTEDAIRDTLSGNDDYGSHTALASVTADVDATRKIVQLLTPFINARAPHLVHHAHEQMQTLVTFTHGLKANGVWAPLGSLSRRERGQLNADTGNLAETLAPVPDLLRLSNT